MLFEQVQRVILAKKYFGVRCTLKNLMSKMNIVVDHHLTIVVACMVGGVGLLK